MANVWGKVITNPVEVENDYSGLSWPEQLNKMIRKNTWNAPPTDYHGIGMAPEKKVQGFHHVPEGWNYVPPGSELNQEYGIQPGWMKGGFPEKKSEKTLELEQALVDHWKKNPGKFMEMLLKAYPPKGKKEEI